MRQFKVGDRVSVRGMVEGRRFRNHKGTILKIDDDRSLEVEFDTLKDGHDGSADDSRITNRWFIRTKHYKTVTVLSENTAENTHSLLPSAADERKRIPLGSGVFDYFTAALIEIAKVSFQGNQQHNPGEPLHWAQEKSTDHFDTAMRHLAERGTRDTDGQRHTAKAAWRVLALLQMELQNEGYPKARGAR